MSPYRMQRREFRHRYQDCSRLLFVGYLAPGSRIEIRCPSCGRMHIIEEAQNSCIDVEQLGDYHIDGTEYAAVEP